MRLTRREVGWILRLLDQSVSTDTPPATRLHRFVVGGFYFPLYLLLQISATSFHCLLAHQCALVQRSLDSGDLIL